MYTVLIILKGFIVSVLASALVFAISLLEASSSPAIPQAPLRIVSSVDRILDHHRLAENLIGHKWQRVGKQERGLAPEITVWEFYADGTFRWRFTSDYTLGYVGAWAISASSDNSGIIFLASAANDRGRPLTFLVLSFEFRNGQLRLGEEFYQKTPFTSGDVPPRIRKVDREAVATQQRSRFFSLWVALTANDWWSESTPQPGDPDRYSFMRDGTYIAHFATTQCLYSGTWSLFSSGVNNGKIRFSIPANQCDPRGSQDAFVREMPIAIRDSKLSIHQTVYLSVPKEGAKLDVRMYDIQISRQTVLQSK